jgi:hypothetical protein
MLKANLPKAVGIIYKRLNQAQFTKLAGTVVDADGKNQRFL